MVMVPTWSISKLFQSHRINITCCAWRPRRAEPAIRTPRKASAHKKAFTHIPLRLTQCFRAYVCNRLLEAFGKEDPLAFIPSKQEKAVFVGTVPIWLPIDRQLGVLVAEVGLWYFALSETLCPGTSIEWFFEHGCPSIYRNQFTSSNLLACYSKGMKSLKRSFCLHAYAKLKHVNNLKLFELLSLSEAFGKSY